MINYIIYTIVSLGCSLLVYRLVLKNQKTFHFNRFFLLVTLVLCLLAPIMEIEIFNAIPSLTEIKFQPNENSVASEDLLIGRTVETVQKRNGFDDSIMLYIYLAIAMVFIMRYALNLFRILKLTKSSNKNIGDLKLVSIDEQHSTSSFFNYLFINLKHLADATYVKCVIQHETIHSKQLHTLDILFIELLSCLFWFNPFVWFYKREIRENHEFIADEQVVQSGIDIGTYSNSIIYSGNKVNARPLTSGFNFIHIKNRLLMLHQSKSSVLKRTFKSVIALALFAAIFTLSSFKDSKPQLVVVIDAGHGGHDSGSLIEKDVVLQISNKLLRYSDKKIKIIETRNSDKYLSLSERVDFINQQKPDLVISLHSNFSPDAELNGVEAFYFDKNDHHEKSYEFSKILLENQLNQFSDHGKVKIAGFYILKNVECPGVVLELGFISNEKDKAILTNDNHQETIAKSLHESLLKIRAYKTK